jgi:hypothetical protein
MVELRTPLMGIMAFNVPLNKFLERTRYAISIPLDKLFLKVKNAISEPAETESDKQEKNHTKCRHHFGYLAKLCRNKPIPEECLLCSRVVDCITSIQAKP